jgi:hypothetical protein
LKKPSPYLQQLYDLGTIHGMIFSYRQVGDDTAMTCVEFIGSERRLTGEWQHYRDYLEIGPDHCSLARLRRPCVQEVEAWEKFEAANAAELTEYARLKKKFT